jgi:tetratricopeptide (TPR) repeat protein
MVPPKKDSIIAEIENKQWLHFILLTVLCTLVYFNSLFNGFVYDDIGTIVENKHIQNFWQNLPAFFSSSYFKIAAIEASYRPVATFSYYALYAIFELNPFGYHLFSLVLHISNVILVYLLMNRFQKIRRSSLVCALLFACHPALTEAVNCISYNEDLLAALFFLVAMLFYTMVDPAGIKANLKYFFISLISFLLALLSKEMAITLPAIILIYDLCLNNDEAGKISTESAFGIFKKRAFYYCGYLVISIFYLVLRFFILANPKESFSYTHASILERIIYLPHHLFSFIKIALFPLELNADYVFSYPENFFQIRNILSVMIITAVLLLSLFLYKKTKLLAFGIWWFFITLFPVYNVIQIFNPLADRYLYLPLVGFCIVVTQLVKDMARRLVKTKTNSFEIVRAGVIVLILIICASVSIARNRDWKDNLTLWTKTVQSSPTSSVAHGSLGRAYQENGLLNKAIAEYETAIQINRRDHKAYYNLGTIYEKQDRVDDAIDQYKKSIYANREFQDSHFNLANLYAKNGLLDKAIPHYQKVIQIDPEDFEARNNLGVIYARQGRLNLALAEWEKVLELDPANENARGNIEKAKSLQK